TTLPTARTRNEPYRSAIAPTKGSAAPHNRFWIATASEKTSRPQPSSCVIGWRKKPNTERGPKPRIAIRQPQPTISTGVRQPSVDGAVEVVVIMPLPVRRIPAHHCQTKRRAERRGKLPLRGRRCGAQHRLFHDRQVDQRRYEARHHRQPPHHVIRSGALVQHAAEPCAEETADLVRQEHKAIQRREPARTEHQR